MLFLIADTFTDSLARLTADEQRAAKTTAFDLQVDPSRPGLSYHKLDRAKDRNFWSLRVSSDIRIIVHRTSQSFLLCYVGHHDKAYQWAERRKLETHPKTGAAQFVEIRERIDEVVSPSPGNIPSPIRSASPLAAVSDQTLLGFGVPADWLLAIREATEDELLDLVGHLPAEAAEAVLQLATGGTPLPPPDSDGVSPFEHPDARRRFRVVSDVEELERALEFPWERWMVFLHPAQRQWVERRFNGPARVSGSAGTGKTVVALHRAAHLARAKPDARILLTTFSTSLASSLEQNLRRLLTGSPRDAERIDVESMDGVGERLYRAWGGTREVVGDPEVLGLIEPALAARKSQGDAVLARFSARYLLAEWREVIDAWQLSDWADYRDVRRLGRKARLSEAQRAGLWSLFEEVQRQLVERRKITRAGMFAAITDQLRGGRGTPYEHVIVDESQDIGIAQMRWLAALAERGGPETLFFAGDLGQRIFQQAFSWKGLGVDVRGRARTLTINYRTSHQIREQADRLLGPEVGDVDGNQETRRGTISVFNGPAPEIRSFDSPETESATVGAWIKSQVDAGIRPGELAIFVRSTEQLGRAKVAANCSGLDFQVLDDQWAKKDRAITIATMHHAKGLEFRAVAVMACDDEIMPLQARIDSVTDESDLEEVYNTERHLLYVACTRARDSLLVTSADPPSEFLADLLG